MNLYEMNNQYQQLLDQLYDEEGNINSLVLAEIDQNEVSTEKKCIAIASYIQNMNAEREAVLKAKSAMDEREKRLHRKMDSLKQYLLDNMEKREIQKITCPYFEIKIKTCPFSVYIHTPDDIPYDYRRIKTEISPDKSKMLADMKVGVVIPGAMLIQNKKLDIR